MKSTLWLFVTQFLGDFRRQAVVGDFIEGDFSVGEAPLRLERAHQIIDAGAIRNPGRIQGVWKVS